MAVKAEGETENEMIAGLDGEELRPAGKDALLIQINSFS